MTNIIGKELHVLVALLEMKLHYSKGPALGPEAGERYAGPLLSKLGLDVPAGIEIVGVAIVGCEALNRFVSLFPGNGLYGCEGICVGVLVFFLVRLAIRYRAWVIWAAGMITAFGGWEALNGIRQFIKQGHRLRGVGLSDLLGLRAHLMHVIPGWLPGECFTLLLLALAFSLACSICLLLKPKSPNNKVLAIGSFIGTAAICCSLCLSLSRAVFWSMILLLFVSWMLMGFYDLISLRRSIHLLAGTCMGIFLLTACASIAYPGIFEVYLRPNISQVRSAQGRFDIWSRSAAIVRSHPMFGIGSSNTALYLLSSASQQATIGFASRSFNLPLQILIEKGIVGFVLYATFVILLIRQFHLSMRNRASPPREDRRLSKKVLLQRDKDDAEDRASKAMQCCFAAGVVAVLLRELTYSSLLDHALTSGLAFTLAALACGPEPRRLQGTKIAAISAASIVLALQWPIFQAWRADGKLTAFYSAVVAGRFSEARDSIEEAIRLRPSNSRYYAWRGYSKSQNLPSQCPAHLRQSDAQRPDNGAIQAAIQDYQMAIHLNSHDAVAHHNLAWLEHLLGNDVRADADWRAASVLDPNTAIFHLSYGMFLEEQGSKDLARIEYAAAIDLAPSTLDSPFFARYQRRDPQGAELVLSRSVALLEEQLKGARDPILEARLGKIYLYLGNLNRADLLLNDAVQQLPDLPWAWFNLGELHSIQGDSQQSLSYYKKANLLDASLAAPYLRMGESDFLNGDKREATSEFKLAAQRWQQIKPVTAAHNNRLYDGPFQLIDDLLPTTLIWYASPCEASAAWQRLSELSPRNREYERLSRTCEDLPSPHAKLDSH